jgi:diguanylate cyclase (GGDEF)-like protein
MDTSSSNSFTHALVRTQHPFAPQSHNDTRFRHLIEHSADGMIIVDREGVVLFANQAAEGLFGRPMRELLGAVFGFPIINAQTTELDIVRPDGAQRVVELRIVATVWEERPVSLAVMRDITERKRAELVEKDRNRVLELMARNQSLLSILDHIVIMVEREHKFVRCLVMLWNGDKLQHTSVDKLPDQLFRAASQCHAEYNDPANGKHEVRPHWEWFPVLARAFGVYVCHATPIYSSAGVLLGSMMLYTDTPSIIAALLPSYTVAQQLASIAIEQHQRAERIAFQAYHDALTGLPNRALFQDRLQQTIARARRSGHYAAVFFVDLDHFKLINDTLGHHAGDQALRQIGHRLHTSLRQNDTVARMGGDEFTLILDDLRHPHDAIRVAQKVLDLVQAPMSIDGREVSMTASIGICLYPTDGETAEDLLRKSDAALYRSKAHGRNFYYLYADEIDAEMRERMELERQLRQSLSRRELSLVYQPQVDLASGEIIAIEALLRWQNPSVGIIAPSTFIPIAEESRLIVDLGTWVLNEACRQNRAWQKAGYAQFRMSVNVSARQFAQPDFVDIVSQALAISGLAPQWLTLELTESLLMVDVDKMTRTLTELRDLGVGMTIDDFGTGYSSLSYLRKLPIDSIKIDQAFVRDMQVHSQLESQETAIVQAVTTLAHTLGMRVVAEGVETQEQLALLRQIGCDAVQGYLLSKPMVDTDVEALLRRGSRFVMSA